MKVLRRGSFPKVKKYRGKCRECETEVEAKAGEVSKLVDRDSPQGAYYVRCPTCGNEWLWVEPWVQIAGDF